MMSGFSFVGYEIKKNRFNYFVSKVDGRLNLSSAELIMKTCNLVLTFESVDVEILWCDHLKETSSAVLLHGTICFSLF